MTKYFTDREQAPARRSFKYTITGIEWDTSDFSEEDELATGCCVPDLPEEIEETEFDREMDRASLDDWLEYRFGYAVKDFDYEELPAEEE